MLQVLGWNLGLKSEVIGRDAVSALVPAWDDLCRRSIEDNVYYSPKYARALLDTVERDERVRFAAIWSHEDLVALLPFTTPRFQLPVLGPVGRGWQSKYTFSCMPLLDEVHAAEAANALLALLTSIAPG